MDFSINLTDRELELVRKLAQGCKNYNTFREVKNALSQFNNPQASVIFNYRDKSPEEFKASVRKFSYDQNRVRDIPSPYDD